MHAVAGSRQAAPDSPGNSSSSSGASHSLIPVAWALEYEPYIAGLGYTMEGERNKGFGRTVVAALFQKFTAAQEAAVAAGRMAPDEQYISGYVVEGNTASVAMLEALGMQRTGDFIWMGYERREQEELSLTAAGTVMQGQQHERPQAKL